jgi:predicted esterase
MKFRRLRTTLFILAALLLLLVAGFLVWSETPAGALDSAQAALQSDQYVHVEEDEWLVFRPLDGYLEIGLILYPGGRVEPAAYAPLAREIAEGHFLVVIVPMPLNLAVLGSERALQVQAAFPEIKHWALGGHSLGGAMAAHFAAEHPSDLAGLVLWGAYSAESDDLSASDLPVLSIYGSRDGLSTPEKVLAAKPRLPKEATYLEIEGGNHAQFGDYGIQAGDMQATISREEQQRQVVQATLDFLGELASR